jgi:hypothetical protein
MTEAFMDQDTFSLGMRKFLKTVGVASQREIEQAVAKAAADGTIAGTETLSVTMTLTVDALQLERTFDGKIALEQSDALDEAARAPVQAGVAMSQRPLRLNVPEPGGRPAMCDRSWPSDLATPARIARRARQVLFTTFTRNLAGDIEQNLKTLCGASTLPKLEAETSMRGCTASCARRSWNTASSTTASRMPPCRPGKRPWRSRIRSLCCQTTSTNRSWSKSS